MAELTDTDIRELVRERYAAVCQLALPATVTAAEWGCDHKSVQDNAKR